jgi:ribonuclease D
MGLPIERVRLVRTDDEMRFAYDEIRKLSHVGFDTESKPRFIANQPESGPHLIQIATLNYAFLFPIDGRADVATLRKIMTAEAILKVGFGLKSDRGPIRTKLGVNLFPYAELSVAVRRLGYKQQVGLQAAVAVVLGQYVQKSKKISTSNWGAKKLSAAQQLYAGNDAYASLCVYLELEKSAPHVLVTAQHAHTADTPKARFADT